MSNSDRLYIVQFPHPGAEHRPQGNEMPWNRDEHRRKFLKVVGEYLDVGEVKRGALTIWGELGFPRPRIDLDSHWISPRLAMGAKATEATLDEVREIWSEVVRQVRSAGLMLGVELDVPPSEPRLSP